MQLENKGKTLWEMLVERVHGGNGVGVAFYNPLGLRVGSAMNIPEFASYDFSVQEIREYNRRMGNRDFQFADYVLRGVNTKSFNAEDTLTLKLRTMPNPAGAHDSWLLRLEDEFGFAEDFLGVLTDDTGIFEISDDKSGAIETFSRLNNLRDPYEAAVLVVAEMAADGKATKRSQIQLKYWDYCRDIELGDGKEAKEVLFVEQNLDTGWFQLWRGSEFFG